MKDDGALTVHRWPRMEEQVRAGSMHIVHSSQRRLQSMDQLQRDGTVSVDGVRYRWTGTEWVLA